MKKLVRDKIVDIMKDDGKTPIYEVADEKHLDMYVKLKITEEAQEVAEASSKEEIIEEIADLFEIINKYAEMNGIEPMDIYNAGMRKRVKKGAFKENHILTL